MKNIGFEEITKMIHKNNAQAERLLLEALESEDLDCVYDAKMKLIQIYGTGEFVAPGEGAIEIPGFPDLDKLKAFVANEIEDDTDVRNMVYSLYYDFVYHNFGAYPASAADAIETALAAVECSDEQDWEEAGKEKSKIILFWLYYGGEYEDEESSLCNITLPSLKNRRKAIELLRYEAVMILDYNPKFGELRDEGELDEFLEEAYAVYPENELLVRNVVERCAVNANVDKIIEIIRVADKKLASFIAIDFLDEWEYLFGYEDSAYTPEIIEKIWLTLTDKGAYAEFLLSLYQFGRAKITNMFGEYEVDLPTLQNEEKASVFSCKNGIELLSAPVEIEP